MCFAAHLILLRSKVVVTKNRALRTVSQHGVAIPKGFQYLQSTPQGRGSASILQKKCSFC